MAAALPAETELANQREFVKMARKLMDKLEDDTNNYEKFKEKLTTAKTVEEVFSTIWDMKLCHSSLVPELVANEKSDAEAVTLRETGNSWFTRQENTRALEYYNLSIKKAVHPVIKNPNDGTSPNSKSRSNSPPDGGCSSSPSRSTGTTPNTSPTRGIDKPIEITPKCYGGSKNQTAVPLAIAYGNRSAVLYEMKYYDQCLKDIERAVEFGYPQELAQKLVARRERCLNALEGISQGHVPEAVDGPSKFKKVIQLETTFAQKLNERLVIGVDAFDVNDPPVIANTNEKAPNLSEAVRIAYIPGKGRGLIAEKDLAIGEVIGVERAVHINVVPKELDMYCSYCLAPCFNPLPCPSCCEVGFCSDDCRTKSLSEEHWLQCKLLPSMYKLDLHKRQLTNLLLDNTYPNTKLLWNAAKKIQYKSPEDIGRDPDGMYQSTSYNAVYNLCDNLEKLDFDARFMHCQMVFCMTKLLEKSGRFFIRSPGKKFSPSKDELVKTGAILLAQSLKAFFNPYQICDVRIKKSIAGGIFPVMSLMNHSCNPSVRYYTLGRNIIHRAIRPIKAGEEVTIGYDLDYFDKSKQSRGAFLKEYFIDCNCEACLGSWPVYDNLPPINYKCISCNVQGGGPTAICKQCKAEGHDNEAVNKRIVEVNKAIKVGVALSSTLTKQRGLSEDHFESLCKNIETILNGISPPCQAINDATNVLVKAFELNC